MPSGRHCSSLADGGPGFVALARHLGGVAVTVVAGLALLGPPVEAQLPPLPPLTLAPSDPSTTTSTLLPPLVPTENLLPPTPGSGTLPATILPLPTTAPPRRTTTFKPPPVPPSTPARALPVKARTARPTPARGDATGDQSQVDDAEPGEGDAATGPELPFAAPEAGPPAGDHTTELGIEASVGDRVGTLASVAAGLVAVILLGVVLWLRREVRREPDVCPW